MRFRVMAKINWEKEERGGVSRTMEELNRTLNELGVGRQVEVAGEVELLEIDLKHAPTDEQAAAFAARVKGDIESKGIFREITEVRLVEVDDAPDI